MATPEVSISATTADVSLEGTGPGDQWQLVGTIDTSHESDLWKTSRSCWQLGAELLQRLLAADTGHRGPRIDCGKQHLAVARKTQDGRPRRGLQRAALRHHRTVGLATSTRKKLFVVVTGGTGWRSGGAGAARAWVHAASNGLAR
jgi:hypothetical protein